MQNKRNKLLKDIKKALGESAVDYVYNLIYNETDLKRYGIASLLNLVGNYTDTFLNGDYSKISNLNLKSIISEWDLYVNDYIEKYKSINYTEKNKIILDYRKNDLGFYWVDLEKLFCIESMIRMSDCGRVNYGHTTLELREQTIDSNISHMIIVYELETGNIKQVKGKSSLKPDIQCWEYFHKFLIDTNYKINDYTPTYKSENDLRIEDFNEEVKLEIFKKHPQLKKVL